tara:strand:+ start:10191 stop:10415 length:225 start_codon:yes stop_codon:yes gene_type:complete
MLRTYLIARRHFYAVGSFSLVFRFGFCRYGKNYKRNQSVLPSARKPIYLRKSIGCRATLFRTGSGKFLIFNQRL